MRRFLLVRHADPSGVSGTGIVAEGVEFTDRSASLRWHGNHPSTTQFEIGLDGIVAIHGHFGATEVIYFDPDPSPEPALASESHDAEYRAQASGSPMDGLCRVCGGAWPCTRCRNPGPSS